LLSNLVVTVEGVSMSSATQRAARQKREKRNRLKAMEHPLRARLLSLLVEHGVQSPTELARALGAELSDVSYHVRRLKELDCAELVSTRPVRGAVEHFYRATEPHLIDGAEWEELDQMMAGELVCEFMQNIVDDFVDSRRAGIVGSDRHFHITRTPLTLDEQGFQKGIEAFERFRLDMWAIEAESSQRLAAYEGTPISVSSSLVYFKVPRKSLQG
jgi:DNA-binding transcriptional ArsR family regulator